MDYTIKKLVALVMSLVVILSMPVSAFAAAPETINIQLEDVVLSQSELQDGVTILVRFNEDGTTTQTTYEDISQIPMLTQTVDGVLEWEIFDLGFTDWVNTTGRLYIQLSCDERLHHVNGKAYVRPVSAFQKPYYDRVFNRTRYVIFRYNR